MAFRVILKLEALLSVLTIMPLGFCYLRLSFLLRSWLEMWHSNGVLTIVQTILLDTNELHVRPFLYVVFRSIFDPGSNESMFKKIIGEGHITVHTKYNVHLCSTTCI